MAWFHYWWLHILLGCVFKQSKIWGFAIQKLIKLHDLFEIITFINPQAIQIILKDPKLFEFLKIIRIKAIDRLHYVQSRILYLDDIWLETSAPWSPKLWLKPLFITTWIDPLDSKKLHKKQIYIKRSLHRAKEDIQWSRKIHFSTTSNQQHPRKRNDCWLKYFWRTFPLLWCSIQSRDSRGLLSILKNTGYWEKCGLIN